MDIRAINDEYAVSGQITVEDLDTIAALGFKSIVCHRPDHEEAGQPEFSAIAARAKELGIEPVSHRLASREELIASGEAPDFAPGESVGYALAFEVR